jgi:hypothetical protein
VPSSATFSGDTPPFRAMNISVAGLCVKMEGGFDLQLTSAITSDIERQLYRQIP